MSYKSSLIKMVIKLTPNIMIKWVANIVLKGIAELSVYNFDLDTRKAHVQLQLAGEVEPIDVWVDGFGIIRNEHSYQFIIHQAESNKLWLTNILAHIVGKSWKIPAIPQLAPHLSVIAEVFAIENPGN